MGKSSPIPAVCASRASRKKTEGQTVELIDSRRLTGLNLQGPGPGAVTEVRFGESEDVHSSVESWSHALDTLLHALDWPPVARWIRHYKGGASLVIDAPLDALYAATEFNEWAVASVSGNATPLREALQGFQASLDDEANPALLSLQEAALDHDVPFVWDDDEVSLGLGRHSQTWPARDLPTPESLNWDQFKRIPFAYITGTNGKTTTTRMTMGILNAAGIAHAGTSTDGVVVNGTEVEQGDWTGPGAARLALRHKDVDLAILETARGGLLRRGLVLDDCNAALITNIANDHLGDYGILEVSDMAQAKGIVCRAVREDGHRILNADDPHLWVLGHQNGPSVIWFSMNPGDRLNNHLSQGGAAWVREQGSLVLCQGDQRTPVVEINTIPACHRGRAEHNVENALASAALAHGLGVDLEHICTGLTRFAGDATDNPGRCNLFELHGVQFLLDFGHNPHGLRAILKMARGLIDERPDGRLCITIGQAGDRSDDDLRGLAAVVHDTDPQRVLLREVPGYERGRERGEVTGILNDYLLEHGHSGTNVTTHNDEADTMKAALEWAQPGDLVVQLVHIDRDAVQEVLENWSPPFSTVKP
jgi:cyanophycin synthetase